MGDPTCQSFYRNLRDEDAPDYRRLAGIEVKLGMFTVRINPSRDDTPTYVAILLAANPNGGGNYSPGGDPAPITLGIDEVGPFIERLILTIDLPAEWVEAIHA